MEPGSAKYQFYSCLPHAWNFAPLWSVHRHPGMLLQQFSPPSICLWHILQMSLMLSLHHWQWWEVRCEISKPGTGPTTQTNSAPGLRTPYLCNIVLQPLLEPVIHSRLSCETLTKHCVMWWRHTQSSQQGQNHTTTKQRDRLFSEMPTILTGDAPPPYHGGFSLWEHCSYPVNFLWACRCLTRSPTQAERVILLGYSNCYRVLLLLQTRTSWSQPSTHPQWLLLLF